MNQGFDKIMSLSSVVEAAQIVIDLFQGHFITLLLLHVVCFCDEKSIFVIRA